MNRTEPMGLSEIDLSEGDSNLSSNRAGWIRGLDDPTRDLLDRDARVFLHQSLSSPCIDVLGGCEGSFLTDISGKKFLDFHGNSVHQVGFANLHVIRAIIEQLGELSFCTRRYTNERAVELAEKLAELAPGDLGKILFAPGATSSVGMALKLARVATGRHKTLSMWDSFHGASLDAISIGGESLFRKNMGPLMPGTEHVPPPEPYRCLFEDSGDCSRCSLKCARYIDYVLDREQDVAAVIAEPVRCTCINPPPPGFWKAVRKSCDRHSTLLIFDETAVCLGRTGTLFAFENYGVIPDMVVIGKGLGGGIMPFSALIARSDLDLAPDRALGHYTHEKNPVACAAALATLGIIETRGLLERSKTLGRQAIERLEHLKSQYEIIGDIRGQGLMFGAELVKDRKTKEPAPEAADRIMYRCLDLGLSFKVSKGNFLTLTPPLTIDETDLDKAFYILALALSETCE
ncbi:(R)-1-hydroxy-2-aminoethylphosphonate ammonia-lyase [Desulfospira joergensenii]|uniref:(R)-1-hydroxy-2-aminoethylphosphonate ammonia-lyase n=1 Tax=Desulfospira joergensenii TaxID=53329 RepID=UPI0003B5DE8D|nr:aspartate aminotransferase family protein [Desulfospira joergensenii]